VSSLKEVRTRLKSVQNIQHITDAMNKIASTRLSKARARVINVRKYAAELEGIAGKILGSNPYLSNSLLNENKSGDALYIVIASDKGLCGDYNTKIAEFALGHLSKADRSRTKLIVFGKKAVDFFNRTGYPIFRSYTNMPVVPSLSDAQKIANEIINLHALGQISSVYLVFAEFVSLARQTPALKQLIPFEKAATDSLTDAYIFEPVSEKLAGLVLIDHINIKLLRALSEAAASEQAARTLSMEQATTNADDVICQLTLVMNRIRQTKITKDLIEIVAASEALQ
jgi:F-type H+-transporting ATPase subunit gamma